jgi:hypothetical protein
MMKISVERNHSVGQMKEFIGKFEEHYPGVYEAIKKNTLKDGWGPIMIAIYGSPIFEQVMG